MHSLLASREDGMGTHPTLPYKTALLVIVFLALAVSHALEVLIKIFRRFRSYHGVYFYSLLAASIGIVIHAFGYFIRNYDISKSAPLEITLACGGGMLMITGQSIVLWSRLHLISPGKQDRWLLWMIIADCIIVQGGATTLFAGSNSSNPAPWLKVYAKWEIFQVTWFFVQECLISGLYIYRTFVLMRSSAAFRGPEAKRIFNHLIVVNVVVIALDVTILAFQYAGLYEVQTSWKTFAYAIKLKLEFDILNQLVDFTKAGFNANGRSGSRHVAGSGDNQRGTAHEGVGGSRFGTSTYARMDEDGVTALPLQNVVKTTEIRVKIEEDASSESSTKELRMRNDTMR
ncbi:Nn.00g026760.m01.CDS01 [Neocucurbitaria sp. VM-36]